MAYNSTVHESTGMSPHMLVYGEKMTIPIDILTDPIAGEEAPMTSDYVVQLQSKLREFHHLVRNTIKKAAERQKKQYDCRIKNTLTSVVIWYGEIKRQQHLV